VKPAHAPWLKTMWAYRFTLVKNNAFNSIGFGA